LRRREELSFLGVSGEGDKKFVEPSPAVPGRDKGPPVGDSCLHRRQRPRNKNGACDDDAGRRLIGHDERGADRQDARLQHHAQHAREGAEPAGDVACLLLGGKMTGVGPREHPADAFGHSHGPHHLGITAARLDDRAPGAAAFAGGPA
jgi:hypothetical protein